MTALRVARDRLRGGPGRNSRTPPIPAICRCRHERLLWRNGAACLNGLDGRQADTDPAVGWVYSHPKWRLPGTSVPHRRRSRHDPNARTMNRSFCPRADATQPTSIGIAGRLQLECVADITPGSPAEFLGMRFSMTLRAIVSVACPPPITRDTKVPRPNQAVFPSNSTPT